MIIKIPSKLKINENSNTFDNSVDRNLTEKFSVMHLHVNVCYRKAERKKKKELILEFLISTFPHATLGQTNLTLHGT